MSFKVDDKVTHPLTGDTVLTVLVVGPGNSWISTYANTQTTNPMEPQLSDWATSFTPYTPPRPSTQELANRVYRAYGDLVDPVFGDQTTVLARVQALAEAATAYAERLEEETK